MLTSQRFKLTRIDDRNVWILWLSAFMWSPAQWKSAWRLNWRRKVNWTFWYQIWVDRGWLWKNCRQKLGLLGCPFRAICIPRISADFFSVDFSINRFFRGFSINRFFRGFSINRFFRGFFYKYIFLHNVCTDDPHIRGEKSWRSHVTVYLATVIVARPGYAYMLYIASP